MKKKYIVSGFSFFEILIALGILTLLMAIALPNYVSIQSQNNRVNQQQVLTEAVTWMSLYLPGLEEGAACTSLNHYMQPQLEMIGTREQPLNLECYFLEDPVNRFYLELVGEAFRLRMDGFGNLCAVNINTTEFEPCL